MRHPDPEELPPSGVPPDTGGPLAGCCGHSGGIRRAANASPHAWIRLSALIPVQSIGPCIRSGPMINGTGLVGAGPRPRPLSQSSPLRWAGCSAFARLRPPAAPRPALPPVRGSRYIGPSGRRRRSPPGSAGRPLLGRAFGRLWPFLCFGLPLAPVGPAPPRLLGRSGSWPGGLCRPAAGLAALWRLAALVRLCRRAARRRAFSPMVSVPGCYRWVGPGACCPPPSGVTPH